ncbi:MAG: hypothetical protein AAGF20_00970 [Pseudomonadota bacterium]
MEDVMTVDDAGLSRLVEWFESAEEASDEARRASERDRDYVDGKQLTALERETLVKRKQPPIVFNVIKDKIGFLMGVEKQQRTDPRAYPRTPQHEQDAEAATDALRYVCEANDLQSLRSKVARNLFVEGAGGVFVGVKQGRDGADVHMRRIAWDRFFYDPHSSESDFRDARYLGEVVWMDYDEAVETYRDVGGEDALNATYNATSVADTYDDKPKWKTWADKGRRRIRIVQMYFKKGEAWYFAEFTKGGLLKGGESPYYDEDDKPCCPMIMESAYVDRENNRYGEVRQYIDPQDEINKRRSKALHIMNTRQIIYEKGAGVETRRVREELAKPDGAVELPPGVMQSGAFQVERNTDMSQGQAALLQDAMAYMDKIGPNAAMLGDAAGQSGRAIQAQQQGGMMEMGDLLDTLRRFDTRVYRAVWNRVRQFWTGERWVRVTDDEKNVRFVGFNRPMTVADEIAEMPEEEQPMAMQRMGLMPNDPRLGIVRKIQNPTAQMDVDIIIEDAPDTITLQSEQFAELVKVIPMLVQAPPQFTELLIRASQLRNKDELLKSLQGADDPQARALQQMQQEVQQLQQQLGLKRAEADVAKIGSEIELNRAKAVNEIQNAQMPPTMANAGF